MHDADGNQIKENGWLQGCVLPLSLVELLVEEGRLPSVSEGELYVVVSHDCDVTNPSLEVEPLVELLRAEVLAPSQKEGSWTWGKNPRHYHLDWDLPDGKRVCHFSIQDRFIIPRTYLVSASPDADGIFDSDDIRALALWLARRYARSAFPDAFVDRTRSAANSLRKILKRHGDLLTAIFAVVNDDELPDDLPYRLILQGSMRVDDYVLPERREKAQELLDKVEAALGDCDGIEVLESHLKSEEQISLDDRRKLKRWDFDDLTIRGQPVSDIPPDD